jgi:release factor glutamine methyltransferase
VSIKKWLENAVRELRKAGIETPELDAGVLLADSLKKDRSYLNAHSDYEIPKTICKIANAKLDRRLTYEPMAYVRGKQEFYGREFTVNKHVLVPRPESEDIIEEFKKISLPDNAVVADVGCGSGALGITAKLECPDIEMNLLDIDENALAIAEMNAQQHKIKSQYYCGNLLEACLTSYDVLLCNLPYIPENYPINQSARHEPSLALFSGKDGLDHYRGLFKQLSTKKFGTPILICESLVQQQKTFIEIARIHRYHCCGTAGLTLVFKYVSQ